MLKTKNPILTYGDLVLLGPCFASVLPLSYLQSLNETDFVNYYSNLGRAFQPDDLETEVVVVKIGIVASSLAQSAQDTFVYLKLKDLALFYPNFTSLNTVIEKFA